MMRKQMLQKLATLLMAMVLGWLAYLVLYQIGRMVMIQFGDPTRLPQLYGLPADTAITSAGRITIFIAWMVTYGLGVIATYHSLVALNEVRLGRLFNMRNTKALIGLGSFLVLALVVGIAAFNLERFIMLGYHPDYTYAFRFWSPLTELPLILCGASFAFIGIVATEAVRLQTENEEIV